MRYARVEWKSTVLLHANDELLLSTLTGIVYNIHSLIADNICICHLIAGLLVRHCTDLIHWEIWILHARRIQHVRARLATCRIWKCLIGIVENARDHSCALHLHRTIHVLRKCIHSLLVLHADKAAA